MSTYHTKKSACHDAHLEDGGKLTSCVNAHIQPSSWVMALRSTAQVVHGIKTPLIWHSNRSIKPKLAAIKEYSRCSLTRETLVSIDLRRVKVRSLDSILITNAMANAEVLSIFFVWAKKNASILEVGGKWYILKWIIHHGVDDPMIARHVSLIKGDGVATQPLLLGLLQSYQRNFRAFYLQDDKQPTTHCSTPFSTKLDPWSQQPRDICAVIP